MKTKRWALAAVWIGCCVLLLIVITLLSHWHKEREEAKRIESKRQRAQNILKHLDSLEPGMSEDDVIKIVGFENWGGLGWRAWHRTHPKTIFRLRDSNFLVFEWELQDVPNDTTNRRMLLDRERNQLMVQIFKGARVSDHPY